MNKDIRVATSFKGHRKRKRLVRELGVGAEIYLLDLWLTVAMDAPTGILTGWDEIDIADAAGWIGIPKIFIDALINSFWLEKNGDGEYFLHDWCEHQGWACKAKERSQAAKKAAEARWDRKNGVVKDADGNADLCGVHAEGNAPSPNPSPNPSPLPKDIPDSKESGEQEFYITKKKRKLTGKRLETFNLFWNAFSFRKGKADAADSWIDIPMLTDSLVLEICEAAKKESFNREKILSSGGTPKWAQGWLTSRRWEDEDLAEKPKEKVYVI